MEKCFMPISNNALISILHAMMNILGTKLLILILKKIREMMVYLERRFEKKLASVELLEKVDLDVTNYLSGKLKKYIKLNFRTINVNFQVILDHKE